MYKVFCLLKEELISEGKCFSKIMNKVFFTKGISAIKAQEESMLNCAKLHALMLIC